MFSSVISAAIWGVEARKVYVEADVSSGLPCFSIVGYATAQVKEAQERVRTALRNAGLMIPPKRVTINLAPADLRKEGNGFDLPVAAAILLAVGRIPGFDAGSFGDGRTGTGWLYPGGERDSARGAQRKKRDAIPALFRL